MTKDKCDFDYKTVATVASDRLFDDLDKVNDLLAHMTGEAVMPHNVDRLMAACRAYFLARFPALGAIDFAACTPYYYDCFVADCNDILGNEVPVPALCAVPHGSCPAMAAASHAPALNR